jgi:hypothetical protein
MMDCLYAKCTPCITDCVMGELEKLGGKCVGPFVCVCVLSHWVHTLTILFVGVM